MSEFSTGNDRAVETRCSLSAMLDGEATEQDIAYLLEQDPATLSAQLESYHLVQQVLHKDDRIATGLNDSLMSRVRAGIEADESVTPLHAVATQATQADTVKQDAVKNHKVVALPWRKLFSGMAVAASVAFVVILGSNQFVTPEIPTSHMIADVHSSMNNRMLTPLAEFENDALQVDNVRLQLYLRQHAEQAAMTVGQGMIPMARVVSYPIKE
ncbi:sigma-E factor negative regulatory protein [Marinomonas algarum]|uniref:Sigma-E factor negative regulatory protein n=1 Tax=Marinomonas algarum TaxID=2883105 RepID=A0A9X1LED3_9GAMM|nr:sigma-E factor negative regulatory protein [Marinomonas algarum]MCB5160960.1 sigma-E factor negative regulatory protein [Marinomonas algarum]